MDLYLFVLDVTERQLKNLVGFYQEQQAVHGNQGVQNLLDVYYLRIQNEWVLTLKNPRSTYPKTLAQRGLWASGLASYLKGILGEGKVVYNER